MTPRTPRSNAQWLEDIRNEETQTEALADLRDYLLRAVFLYLDRYREDLTHLDRRELEHLAEDFAQEALMQIQAKLDSFRGDSKFTTWAYPFVINVAAGELRRHRWRTLSLEMAVSEGDAPLFAFLGDREAPDPETAAARRQIIDIIQQIIDEDLTERQRVAMVAVHFNGVPMSEVAQQLDSTVNNIYKLLHDARKKLKKGLEQRYFSQADVLAIFGDQ